MWISGRSSRLPRDAPISRPNNSCTPRNFEKTKICFLYLKIGTIDKEHLSITTFNLAENTAYAFKIINQLSSDEQNNIIQEFKFETASG